MTFKYRLNVLNVRHERSSQELKEQRDGGVQARDVATQPRAQRKQSREEGNACEEQGNEVEGEHEATEVVELVCADERRWNAVGGAEIPHRVEWKRRHCVTAVGIETVRVDTTDSEERPSRRVTRGRLDGAGVGLEEVELVLGVAVDAAGKDDEELQEDTTSKENEGDETKDWTCDGG